MNEKTKVNDLSPLDKAKAKVKSWWQKRAAVLVPAFMSPGMVPMDVGIQPSSLITNTLDVSGLTDGLLAGFYGGANIVLGMDGLILIMAIPVGLMFALGLIASLFDRFRGIRI